jgi:succinate dehydrogenase/fumarate reductase flavoprotein subunit
VSGRDVEQVEAGVLVLGSGLAGLAAALAAREAGADVLVLSRTRPGRGSASAVSTAVLNAALGLADPADSPEAHYEDTLAGGAHLADPAVVRRLVEEVVPRVAWLEGHGVTWVREADGRLRQIRSPGHRHARSLLPRPLRGTTYLTPLVAAARRLGVRFLAGVTATRILVAGDRAVGVVGYDEDRDAVVALGARALVLCTGGASLLYRQASAPPGSPGDGFALALGAGATLQNMEFVQFYPVALAEPGLPHVAFTYEYFLRHGARFLNARGEDLVARHGLPPPDRITRDLLAVAIGREIAEGRSADGAVWLDAAALPPRLLDPAYAETVWARLLADAWARGENLLARPVRVRPLVHYYMGGVRVDADGQSDLAGLLAVGEAATGQHGANRLQGNSFTDCVALGTAAGRRAAGLAARLPRGELPAAGVAEERGRVQALVARTAGADVGEVLRAVQAAMSDHAGLVRHAGGLARAAAALADAAAEAPRATARNPRDRARLVTLGHLVRTAELVAAGAARRAESRGAHFRSDHPAADDARWRVRLTYRRDGAGFRVDEEPVGPAGPAAPPPADGAPGALDEAVLTTGRPPAPARAG